MFNDIEVLSNTLEICIGLNRNSPFRAVLLDELLVNPVNYFLILLSGLNVSSHIGIVWSLGFH